MEQTQNGQSGDVRRLESSPLLNRIIDQDDIDQLYRIFTDLPKTHNAGCPSCGKNLGPFVDGKLMLADGEWTCNCHDQLQRQKHYLNSGIGMNYQFLSWNDFVGDPNAKMRANEYLNNLSGYVESGVGVLLIGEGYGTGKTLLSTLLLKAAVMLGYKCYFTTFVDMLSSMKTGWKDADYAKWYKKRIDSAQILVIDDVGKELMSGSGFNNDYARQVLDGLMRTRVQQGRPTIITSNMLEASLEAAYGSAFISLLLGHSVGIPVNGSDFRKNFVPRRKGERRIY